VHHPKGIAALALILAAGAALAQTSVGFDAGDRDPDEPVEVTADRLDVNQTDGTAVFTGNVVVVQGDLTLTADRVRVEYGETQPREIERIFAFDNVVLVSPTETAEGAEAVYERATETVVMIGDVVLTQELNVVSGDVLTIDLVTGEGVVEGRVRTLLRTGGE
jgi:lipopolysaccharide export system protein LptA